MDGILPVYKPVGITSFDVIRAFKRAVHPDFKVGHGGTLDPFADGVLLLLLGKATKKMNELSALPKTYRAVAVLGASSDTLDVTGVIVEQMTNQKFSNSQIEIAAEKFVGEIEQAIPDYSATKINGVPRYKLARRGVAMESKSKKVTIYSIENIQIKKSNSSNLPAQSGYRTSVEMTVTCSAGTYSRQLSYDIFKTLGIESYLESLTRTQIGDYKIDDCVKIDSFTSLEWQDLPAQAGKVVPLA